MSKHREYEKRYVARYMVKVWWGDSGVSNTYNILHKTYEEAQQWGEAFCNRYDKCSGFAIVKKFVEDTEDEM